MIKTSIGELKLSPVKENGKFVFINDFITINGKVSKGDRIHIYVDAYELNNGKYLIKATNPSSFMLIVRGEQFEHIDNEGHQNIEDLYSFVSEQYKSHFYFGKKS